MTRLTALWPVGFLSVVLSSCTAQESPLPDKYVSENQTKLLYDMQSSEIEIQGDCKMMQDFSYHIVIDHQGGIERQNVQWSDNVVDHNLGAVMFSEVLRELNDAGFFEINSKVLRARMIDQGVLIEVTDGCYVKIRVVSAGREHSVTVDTAMIDVATKGIGKFKSLDALVACIEIIEKKLLGERLPL